MRGALTVGWISLALGCASTGGADGAPNVRVYLSSAELPCEYEVIRTLRRESSQILRSPADYERVRTDVLGRAGARIGADAVIVEDLDLASGTATGTARRREIGGGSQPTVTFTGKAVRFIPDTCRQAAPGDVRSGILTDKKRAW